MFTISVETHFWASHQLTLPDGRKEPPHCHNWSVTANVSSNQLNPMGLVINFHRLKSMIDNIIAQFDNVPLDSIDYFQQNNPSAENVAKYIYEKLEAKLPQTVKLQSVRVVEQPGCWVEYHK